MKISKKAEYALRAMLILADSPPNRPLQIQELASAGSIPLKFLEQILLSLKKGGILRSKRGVGGGYQLDRPARTISLAEIIRLIDGGLCALENSANNGSGSRHGAGSLTRHPGSNGLDTCFREVDQMVNAYFESKTLDEILALDRPSDVLAFEI